MRTMESACKLYIRCMRTMESACKLYISSHSGSWDCDNNKMLRSKCLYMSAPWHHSASSNGELTLYDCKPETIAAVKMQT
eukprot:SAG11_NODE_2966_length_2806_cov_2.326334_3_plen_80_part_00